LYIRIEYIEQLLIGKEKYKIRIGEKSVVEGKRCILIEIIHHMNTWYIIATKTTNNIMRVPISASNRHIA